MNREKQIAERTKWVPVSGKKCYARAVGGKSRPSAVKAMCGECLDCDRADIRDCQSGACPLWPYRPYQSTKKTLVALVSGAQD